MGKNSILSQYGGRDISLLKLHDIFLRKFLLLFTAIFITLGVIFYFWIKDIYIEQTKIDLLNNIDIISLQVKDLKNIDQKAKEIKKLIGLRVTIVDNDGIVIGESDKDKSEMDNHKNRQEIIESKYQKYGSVTRYSNTIKKELLYVSKKFQVDDETVYIRMARDIELINQDFFYLSLKIAMLFLVSSIVAFLISLKISKEVEFETNEILKFLDKLSNQTKSLKISSNYSVEFENITKLLTKFSFSLSKKDKQKSKYTAKLKLSNRQKDDIISAISHEFKNPIAVISGYSQTLLEDKNINSKIRDKFLHKIGSNANKLTSMIDRLRLSIRLEEGKQTSNFIKSDLSKLTSNIIEDLKISYPDREINLISDDIKLNIDETMFSIAVTNLIENALKYSLDDIIVEISDEKLSVIDSGIGIKQKDISKITDKFYRVSSNGWDNSLGVGLSLVSNILKLHTFKLDIQSVEDEGSTFSIFFK
jgi:signal transduction histidine kinase